MHVTLINPPALPGRLNYSAFCHPPLGLSYLAACLREEGRHTVSVVDAVGEAIDRMASYPEDRRFLVQGLPFSEILSRISRRTDLIGISCMFTHAWPLVRQLVKQIHAAFPGVPIIAGGEHPTALYALCLDQAPLTACVLGEGERTLVCLADALESGRPLSAVDGLAWKDPATGQIHKNSGRQAVPDPDDLPDPAWELIPWRAYRLYEGPATAATIPMLASRGCPHACAFCSAPAMWPGGWRKRRAESIVREMRRYATVEQIREFQFVDISPLIDRKWFLDLCRLIRERLPDIRWQMPVGGRPEIVDQETADLMVDSGCRHIQFAPESGSPEVLAAMHKRLDLDRFRSAVRHAGRAGMIVSVLFIIGYPTEKLGDIRQTYRLIRWLAKQGVAEIAISSFALLPGTKIFADLAADRKLAIDDAFCYQTAGATAFIPSKSWNPSMGKIQLLILKWLGLIQFYAIAFARRPGRLVRMAANLIRGRQETKADRVLAELAEKFRRGTF